MTVFLLIRHARHDDVGHALTGRQEGVRLGRVGRIQALRLAERMTGEGVAAIYSSPQERARETAAAVAIACETGPVEAVDGLDEIDFGDWSGRTFEELDGDAGWREWNELRDRARTPAGESMADVQVRVMACLDHLRKRHPDEAVVAVSHADVIKAAVCQVLGLPADACFRFDIDPASITRVVMGDWGAKLISLNETV